MAKVVFFHQGTEQPEGGDFPSVEEEDCCDEIHTLYIPHLGLVVGKRNENSFQTVFDLLICEVRLILECSVEIHGDVLVNLDLLFRFIVDFYIYLKIFF